MISANVAYNFQKTPYINVSNKAQSIAGLSMALRDNTNDNRNVSFIFPINMATPNLGAGSPTLFAVERPSVIGPNPTVGRQISGLGEIS